eukprot:6190326-Pleurochrysis_carterae.AAC.4
MRTAGLRQRRACWRDLRRAMGSKVGGLAAGRRDRWANLDAERSEAADTCERTCACVRACVRRSCACAS